jgi:hypothetical protein
VSGAPAGTIVETSVTKALLGPEGTADVPHRAGPTEVRVRTPAGGVTMKQVTLVARSTMTLDFVAPAPTPDARVVPTPPVAVPGSPSWQLPLGIVSGVIGVGGVAAFAGLGLSARATYDRLEGECAPNCGDADRADADAAEREQLAASISLAVGATALVVATVLILTNRSEPKPAAGAVKATRPALWAGARSGAPTVLLRW